METIMKPPLLHPLVLFVAWTIAASAQQQVVSRPPFEVYRTIIGQGETFGIGNGLSAGKPNDDTVYAVSSRGSVYTLRESDGTQLNAYARGDASATSSSRLDWDGDGELGVYAERNSVVLVNARGAHVDEFAVTGTIAGQPILHFGSVFVSHNEQDSGNGLVTVYSPTEKAVVAQFTRPGATVGPCGKNSDYAVYHGTSLGEVIAINVSTLGRAVVSDGFDANITGTPFVTRDESRFLIQSQEGSCYMTKGPSFSLVGDFQCNNGVSAVGALIPPSLSSNDVDNFYVVGGSSIYAWRSEGSLQWAKTTDGIQTKAVLDTGDFVYVVGSSDGRIDKISSATGLDLSGYPYYCDFGNTAESCSQGLAEAYALLSEDESKVLRLFNDGTLVVTCVECLPSNAPSVFGIPTMSPTMFPSGLSTTVPPSTRSPVPPATSPPSGGPLSNSRFALMAIFVLLLTG